ncbi:MAG: hypothetical protein QM751_15560 [Paludibacteraceae bacterium]
MRTAFLCIILTVCSLVVAQKSTMIKDILRNSADQKVTYIQHIINLNDTQTVQLKDIEYRFLVQVQKAKNCCLTNSAKKIEKFRRQKNEKVQKY